MYVDHTITKKDHEEGDRGGADRITERSRGDHSPDRCSMNTSLRIPLLVILFLAVAGRCFAQQSDYVVLDSSEAAAAVKQCSRWAPEIEGSWNPTKEDVAKLEANLRKISALKADSCCALRASIEHPEKFIRQYVGIIVGGRKLVYVNAFFPEDNLLQSKPGRPDWRKVALIICDGGEYFWGVIFDPCTATFSGLAMNGVG